VQLAQDAVSSTVFAATDAVSASFEQIE